MNKIEGLNPEYRPLTKDETEVFLMAVMMESKVGDKEFIPKEDYPPLLQIVMKRIEAMELPIKFTDTAKMVMLSMIDGPGKAIVFLIDALALYEGKTVTGNMIAEDLYPFGFYTDDSFGRYVDHFIRPHKVKWAGIYLGQPDYSRLPEDQQPKEQQPNG